MEFATLGGYGMFVWPAFVFTFVCCFSLYLKTRKELTKQEKLFLIEYKQVSATKIEVAKQGKLSEEVLSTGTTY